MPEERWLTTEEAMAELGVGKRAVQALIARGRLVAEKRGRDWFIRPDSIKTLDRKPGWPAGKPRKKPPRKTRGK